MTRSQVAIHGSIEGYKQGKSKIFLEYWFEDGWKQATSVALDSIGHFDITFNPDHTGQYRLRLAFDPKKTTDFVVVAPWSGDKDLRLALKMSDFDGKAIRLKNDKENEAYEKLGAVASSLIKDMQPDDSRRWKRFVMLNAMCDDIQANYAGTFTAQIVAPLLYTPLPDSSTFAKIGEDSLKSYSAKHGLDRIPFAKKEILYHVGFVKKINQHFPYFKDHGSIPEYIDQVMTKSLNNDELFAFAFRYTLEKMLDHKSEEGLSYLILAYAQDCTENAHLPETTKNLLLALDRCKPGNQIPLLSLPDLDGKRIALEDVYKKNKITILMFWRSNCTHCKEFEPELEEIYKKYHDKGVEVYAIGADKEEGPWKEAALANHSPWKSVFLAYDSRKDFSKTFPVPSTPTLIAVDANGKILRRLIMRSQLTQVLDELLLEVK